MKFLSLILLSCLAVCHCYPGGAPSCKTSMPSHDKIKAKTGKSPFTLVATAPKALANGDKTLTVTITGSGGKSFKGFQVTARVPNTSTTIGKFTATADSKLLTCSSTSNAVTHKDNDEKTSVTLTWTAPKKFKGKVEFRATVVKEYKEFYTNVRSSQVTIS
ncbi:unnamed protein product [Oppiella nova]|uniref:Reelin domain-containing protein n=1 Tax=Oppiella nova TaxID=334625 RepID=A0A7R9M8C8_9ACAR|nr:unnamed protein product [Oppiella nova]CAG2171355.1 unnamed protein product [Oppiella nova]